MKRSSLVTVAIRDIGGNDVVLAGGSKGVVISLVKLILECGLCHHAGGTLDWIRKFIKSLVIGRAFIGRSVEWVVEAAGQTGVVFLRPGRGEAGNADGE